MLEKPAHLSTIDDIKRFAKHLKAEQGLVHHEALAKASIMAGYQNFRHAQNALNKPRLPLTYPVYISAHWKDRITGESGLELFHLDFPAPRLSFMRPEDIRKHRAFFEFRNSGPDHIENTLLQESKSRARDKICHAARALQFMYATKLRPSAATRIAYPGGSYENEIPGNDHSSIWYDPTTKQHVYVDEPYEGHVEGYISARAAWAARHGKIIARPTWRGMYNPDGHSQIFLVCDKDKGIPIESMVAALNALPAITSDVWTGETRPYMPPFVSPGALELEAQRKARPRPAPVKGPRNTVGYTMKHAGSMRRPATRMPIEVHKEVGTLLKSLLVIFIRRNGVYNPINSVRSQLDDWVQMEYPSEQELPSEVFQKLYYSDLVSTFVGEGNLPPKESYLEVLKRAKSLLAQHYPDCAPLRAINKKLDRAATSIASWRG